MSQQKLTILDEAVFITWLYNMYVVTRTRPHRAEIHWPAVVEIIEQPTLIYVLSLTKTSDSPQSLSPLHKQ